MIFEGNDYSLKTEKLVQSCVKLINSGVNSSEILVLCSNPIKKQRFINDLREKITIPVYGELRVKTFQGLCYDFIPKYYNILSDKFNFSKITPDLCGMETSRIFMKKAVSEGFEDYFSKRNLLQQLFRRYSLYVMNALSKEDIKLRSEVLKESFAGDIENALSNFKKYCFGFEAFDYLVQTELFPYVYKNPEFIEKEKIKYLFVDDGDEITPSDYEFIKNLIPKLKKLFVSTDEKGSSGIGFLCAMKNPYFGFDVAGKKVTVNRDDTISKKAEKFFVSAQNHQKTNDFKINNYPTRFEMLARAKEKIFELVKNHGISEIFSVTSIFDDMTKEFFKRSGLKVKFLDGSRNITENTVISGIITVLKMMFPVRDKKIEKHELTGFFNNMLKLPYPETEELISKCLRENNFSDYQFDYEKFDERYSKFLEFYRSKIRKEKLSEAASDIFDFFASPRITSEDVRLFAYFKKQLTGFEKITEINDEKKGILLRQFEKSVISENPSTPEEIPNDALVVGTPMKTIKAGIKRKYGIWLDVSSELWTMRDIGPLYNARVFASQRKPEPYDFEENAGFSRDKNIRMLRKLMLCSSEDTFIYASDTDIEGRNNFGEIPELFYFNETTVKNVKNNFVPQPDQVPVLEYNKGKIAINAVPGAGKTTVLTELAAKLLKENPSREICMVTYMDSAAKTFSQRLKKILPPNVKMPYVSTIHALALKIIKENDNFTKVGLSENFSVADDNLRTGIINELFYRLDIEQNMFDEYSSGISTVKLYYGKNKRKYISGLNKFYKFFDDYNIELKKRELIDYDDILAYAYKVLDENPEIRDYYSKMFDYVIEDEAQDSSDIQQEILSFISGKGNFLRCGDVNQAITSSFTSSNPENFRKFIRENPVVSMTSSRRSSVQIQELANKLVEYSLENPELKNSFFPVKISPAGVNPVVSNSVNFKTFNNFEEEKYFIEEKISELSGQYPEKTIGILLRNNRQVEEYSSFLRKKGLTVIKAGDILKDNDVFKTVFAFLNFRGNPVNKKSVSDLMNTLNETGLFKFSEKDFEFVKNSKLPFIKIFPDDIESENLLKLRVDLSGICDIPLSSPSNFVLKLCEKYFSTEEAFADACIICSLIEKIYDTDFEFFMNELEKISKRPVNFKFNSDKNSNSKIFVMTVHKSKGAEFDTVFLPEFSQENYTVNTDKIKIKSIFPELLRESLTGEKRRDKDEIKRELAEETMRLIYVAFTRAKERLFVTYSKKRNSSPSEILDIF